MAGPVCRCVGVQVCRCVCQGTMGPKRNQRAGVGRWPCSWVRMCSCMCVFVCVGKPTSGVALSSSWRIAPVSGWLYHFMLCTCEHLHAHVHARTRMRTHAYGAHICSDRMPPAMTSSTGRQSKASILNSCTHARTHSHIHPCMHVPTHAHMHAPTPLCSCIRMHAYVPTHYKHTRQPRWKAPNTHQSCELHALLQEGQG